MLGLSTVQVPYLLDLQCISSDHSLPGGNKDSITWDNIRKGVSGVSFPSLM